MTLLRRLGLAALALTIIHIVLAPVVRITGSGMGCGPHWPTCHGYWFPPFDRMDLVIEVMHRYIAASLMLSLLALLGIAIARRATPGVGGRGGVLRGAVLAVLLTVLVSVLGGITVKLHLPAVVTASHFVLAMLLVAALVATVQRAGGLGAGGIRGGGVSRRTYRGATAAAGLALAAVAMGALTAKVPGAAAACQGFPLCRGTILPQFGAQHVQFTHRIIAFLLLLHLIGIVIGVARRGELAMIIRTSRLALAAVAAQIVVAAGLVLMNLPQQLQWLHSAMATVVWLAVFTFYALARRGALGEPVRAAPAAGAVLARPGQALPPAEPAPAQPHTMAVIIARGADL